jgi:hypothetical protein
VNTSINDAVYIQTPFVLLFSCEELALGITHLRQNWRDAVDDEKIKRDKFPQHPRLQFPLNRMRATM